MDASDYYNRGKKYYEKENYSQAIADFWKAMELTHDNIETFREKVEEKDCSPDVLAIFLYETLRQIIG